MDRKTLAACAALAAAALAGCDAKPQPAPVENAPLVLAELQRVSPGPWRRLDGAGVEPATLERPVEGSLVPPSVLDPAEVNELKSRMEGSDQFVEPPAYDLHVADPDAAAGDPGQQRPHPGPYPEFVVPAAPALPSAGQSPAEPSTAPPRILTPHPEPRPVTSQRLPGTETSQSVPRSQLPWAGRPPVTPQMQAVLDEAEARVRQAFILAGRNALYLAREEFTGALELVAQANDIQSGTQFYTESLDAGLTALEESRDFCRPRPVGKRLDMPRIVSGHRTPILKGESLEGMSAAAAAQRYYGYAQEQLAGAAAGEARSSIALYGLGKAVIFASGTSAADQLEGTARGMVLYQAALMADRGNYKAANELGCILARTGDLPRSRDMLVHSIRLSPHPVPYRNLAAVLAKMGETQLAERAANEALALEQTGRYGAGPAVQWVDAATFAGTVSPSDSVLPPVAQQTGPPAATKNQPAATAEAPAEPPTRTARGFSDWLPWTRR